MGIEQRIQELEEKLEKTPVNKATETERGRIKGQIAKLKEEKQKKQKSTGDTSGYAVQKRGDATAALVGFPSVGKSSLLNTITNAEAETGQYEFTTLEVNPGMLQYKGANIQILDVPGLIGGAADGRGDGSQVLSVIRNADIVIILLDSQEMREQEIKKEIEKAGIRINQKPPNVKIEKKDRGGINISTTVEQDLQEETIKQVMQDNGYTNAEIIIREKITLQQLIDAIMNNRKYLPAVEVVNKIDLLNQDKRKELEENYDLCISTEEKENLDELKELIFEGIGLIRVYMKEKGKEPDKDEPLILRKDSTVEDALEQLPGNMEQKFKKAVVTGESTKFPEQEVGKEHTLEDEDILQLNLKNI